MNASKPVSIFDTTLRDGEQSPGVSFTPDEKLEIARQLARLGVDVIEAGFPITSQGEFEAVRLVARSVRGVTIAALARAEHQDIDRAWEAIRDAESPRIHVFIATSDIHMKHKLRKSPEEVLAAAVDAIRYAKRYTNDVEFSAEDATRSSIDFLTRVCRAAVEAGATTINIPDTVGYTMPAEYVGIIQAISSSIPNRERVSLSVHCHDDLGMAVANSLAAVKAGIDQVECTINGLGERAGNTALEELVMALRVRKDLYGRDTKIVSEEIYRTSKLVSRLSGLPVQANKAIVGSNAFAHESGIHQDGVLKERTTYEIMRPQDVGLSGNQLVLGKTSGRHAFRQKLIEMGYSLEESEFERAFGRFKELADKKKGVTERDLQAVLDEMVYIGTESCRLEYFHISTGSKAIPMATVLVTRDGKEYREAAMGDGPVDAICKAVDKACGISGRLVDYSVRSVTSGKDALGEVALKVEYDGRIFLGKGVSTDIIEASARAYVNAVNKILTLSKSSRPLSQTDLPDSAPKDAAQGGD